MELIRRAQEVLRGRRVITSRTRLRYAVCQGKRRPIQSTNGSSDDLNVLPNTRPPAQERTVVLALTFAIRLKPPG